MARRVISWIAALGLTAAVVGAALRARGSDPLLAELHWLLRDAVPPVQALNRACELLAAAGDRASGDDLRLIEALLNSGRDAVTRNALSILKLRLQRRFSVIGADGSAQRVWTTWAGRQSDARLLALMPESFHCFVDGGTTVAEPAHAARATRFVLIATLRTDPPTRSRVELELTFRVAYAGPIAARLRRLDGLNAGPLSAFPLPPDPRQWPPIELDGWSAATVEDLLRDPLPQVRWAIGRILTVCRDPRGRDAVREWLAEDPHVPRGAVEVVAGLLDAPRP